VAQETEQMVETLSSCHRAEKLRLEGELEESIASLRKLQSLYDGLVKTKERLEQENQDALARAQDAIIAKDHLERNIVRQNFNMADITEAVRRWKPACEAAQSEASANFVVAQSRDSEIEALKLQNQQLKSQVQSTKREYQDVQANLGEYLKIMESTATEVVSSNRRRLQYPILATEFVSIYPYEYGTERSELPVIDRYDNTRNLLNVEHARRNILDSFHRAAGGDALETLISGLESRTSHLPGPDNHQYFTRGTSEAAWV
jgi:hypothetical protein